MIFVALYSYIERKLAARAEYNRIIDELSLYSERDLFDLHLSTADIPALAADAARAVEDRLLAKNARRIAKVREAAA